jgi:hypothetical protein
MTTAAVPLTPSGPQEDHSRFLREWNLTGDAEVSQQDPLLVFIVIKKRRDMGLLKLCVGATVNADGPVECPGP